MRRVVSFAVVAAALATAGAARADDTIGLAAFVGGLGTSRSNATSGEGVSALVGWKNDLAVGRGVASYRLGLDAMLGGGDHVLAERLRLAFLPGLRARLGAGTSAAIRVGVDATYDRVTTFTARHVSLPMVELGLRWTSSPSRGGGAPDLLDRPTVPPVVDSWLTSLVAATLAPAAMLDPTRGRDAVSLDVALHGGLALSGRWAFFDATSGERRDVAGAFASSPTAALGANATVAVSGAQLRSSYTRFTASNVDEVRGGLCASALVLGACTDGLVVRLPRQDGPGHVVGVSFLVSVGLVLGGHGSF
jgi:hypothetical protein